MQTTTPVCKNYQAKEMCVATMFDLDLPLNYTTFCVICCLTTPDIPNNTVYYTMCLCNQNKWTDNGSTILLVSSCDNIQQLNMTFTS